MAVYEDKRPNRQGKLKGHGYYWADRECWAEGFEGQRYREKFLGEHSARMADDYVKRFGKPPTDPNMLSDRQQTAAEKAKAQAAIHAGPTWGALHEAAEAAGGPKGLWRNALKRRTRRGINRTALNQRKWIVSFFGKSEPVAALTEEDIDRFTADLEKRPGRDGETLSQGTVNRYLSQLSSMLKFARTRKLVKATPVITWRKEGGRRFQWFETREMEDTFTAALREREWHAEADAVTILCATGLRWSEFDRLEPYEVLDHENDRGTWEISVAPGKTETPRKLSIDPAYGQLLLDLLKSGRVPVYSTMRKRFIWAREHCGYHPHLTIHCCRHTTASRLAHAKMDIEAIQRFMGHKTVSITMRYIKAAKEAPAEIAQILGPQCGVSPRKPPLRVIEGGR